MKYSAATSSKVAPRAAIPYFSATVAATSSARAAVRLTTVMSVIPSAAQITAASERKLVLEDWQNFGPDYDTTLMRWYANISSAWDDLPGYDERFRRMWTFYLLSSAGSFRARFNHLWQIVFSRDGLPETYRRVT